MVSEGVEIAIGEKSGEFRSEADAEKSDAAAEHAFGGIVFGSERECSGVWQSGQWKDAPGVRCEPGVDQGETKDLLYVM